MAQTTLEQMFEEICEGRWVAMSIHYIAADQRFSICLHQSLPSGTCTVGNGRTLNEAYADAIAYAKQQQLEHGPEQPDDREVEKWPRVAP